VRSMIPRQQGVHAHQARAFKAARHDAIDHLSIWKLRKVKASALLSSTLSSQKAGLFPPSISGPIRRKKGCQPLSPWRRRRQYPSAFIVESLGEHVFWNTHAWSETSERFNKLERIAGPNVPQEMVKDHVAAAFEALVSTDLPARLEHEIRVLTDGAVSWRAQRATAPEPQLRDRTGHLGRAARRHPGIRSFLFLENRDFGFGKMQPEQPKPAVTLEALADVLGITLHAAKKALKHNLFERLQRGRYALAASVQAYHRADVESAVKRAFEATNPEDEVSVSRLGDVLGIGERWVQQLEAQGVLRKSARGRYPLAASVQAYTKFKVDSEVARANPEESKPGERIKVERARKLKLENDERERQTVSMSDALIALDVIFGMIKVGFAGVPARVTDDVALRRRIEDGNEAVLRDLARRFRKASSAMREGRDPDAAVEEDDG